MTERPTEHFISASSRHWTICGLFVLLVFGYPLIAFWLPIVGEVGNRILSIMMRAFLAGLSLYVLWTIGIKKRHIRTGWYLKLFLAFWALYTLRMLLDVVYIPKNLGRPGYEYFLFGLGGALLPALALHVKFERRSLDQVYVWMIVGAALACIGNILALREVIASGDWTRIEHETLNPISLGHLGTSLVILSSYGIVRPDVLDSRRRRVVLPLFFMLGLVCVGLGTSRGPVLALVCALCVLILIHAEHRREKNRQLLKVFLLIIGTGLAASWYFSELVDAFIVRFQEAQQLTGYSTVVRLDMWERAWMQFVDNPILGDALVERERVQYPHNVIVESFMATGILGGVIFLMLLLHGSLSAFKLVRRRPEIAWVALLAIQYMVGAMFSGSVWGNGAMWGMMTATVALTEEIQVRDVRVKS